MNVLARRLLRVALVVLLLGTVLAQVLLPVFGSEEGRIYSELAYLVVPYSIVGIAAIACVQVALLAVWRLLSLVDAGEIFTRGALRWVDAIAICGALAAVLGAGVLVHLLFVVRVGGPLILALAAILAGGLAFVLLMVVLRGLLESAIADRSELEAVI
jgi:hypothetical protein